MTTTAIDPAVEERDRLVMEHLPLVKGIASRLAQRVPAQVEVSELISVGVMGLIDAASRYKPSLGVPFDAFARRRVHGAMLDSLRQLDWAPRTVRRMRRDLDRTVSNLRHDLKREPTAEEIAAALHLTDEGYRKMLDQVRAVDVGTMRSLSSETNEGSLIDLAIDPDEGPHAQLERAELKRHLAAAILSLPERERQILDLYYQKELTLAEIGAVIGVGESRVSQLRTQAIGRLRVKLRETLQITDAA